MEGFPSGQREQTVNLSSMTSVVRIHHLPPKQKDIPKGMSFFCFGGRWLWIRKVALRNSPVGCFNHRGFRRNGSESTTGRAGRRVAVRLGDCTSQLRQARALNGALALRNVPVARFNRRGLPVGRQPLKYLMVVPAAKRIHHRTGRQACGSATMGGNNQSRQARAQSEGKNRLFDSEINLYRLFGTIYCRLRRYPVGAHSVRPDSAKSYGSWANTPTR